MPPLTVPMLELCLYAHGPLLRTMIFQLSALNEDSMRTCRRSKCSSPGPTGHPVDGAAPGAPESAMGDRKGGWLRVVLPGLPASGRSPTTKATYL